MIGMYMACDRSAWYMSATATWSTARSIHSLLPIVQSNYHHSPNLKPHTTPIQRSLRALLKIFHANKYTLCFPSFMSSDLVVTYIGVVFAVMWTSGATIRRLQLLGAV